MKYLGKSKCPFCGGTKTRPFTGGGKSQDCTDCDKNGMILNSKLVKLDLHEFIENRGGSGRGQGRKPQNQVQGKKLQVCVTLTKEHAARTSGRNRSKMVEAGLDLLFEQLAASNEI